MKKSNIKKNQILLLLVVACIALVGAHYYFDTNYLEKEIEFVYLNTSTQFANRTCSLAEQLTVPVEPIDEADLVFATAASSNHFEEVKSAIGSTQKMFPEARSEFVDLGLKAKEVEEVKRWCNVRYHKFPFQTFHETKVDKLFEYRWKPLVVAMMLREHSRVFWMDASVRWKETSKDFVKNNFRSVESGVKSPVIVSVRTGHSIYAATNPAALRYFPHDGIKKAEMFGATLIYFQRHPTTTKLLKLWTLCALEDECMGPRGSKLSCKFVRNPWTRYAGCHRFDQSVINLILLDEYGRNESTYLWAQEFATVKRSPGPDSVKLC